MDDVTGKPVCFGNWLSSRRKNDPTKKESTNAQCKICPTEVNCRAKAEQKAAAKTTTENQEE